jgi:hypothetical protein
MDGFKQQESAIKSGARLQYGPGLLRLIESPDFRRHFEKEAWPAATKRLSGVQMDRRGATSVERINGEGTAETGESDAEDAR